MSGRRLRLVDGSYAICRLDSGSETPEWLDRASFHSVTRTERELSIVCATSCVPDGVTREEPWKLLELAGPIPFEEVGVVAALAGALAAAGVSIFVVSTYDTDFLLVKDDAFATAVGALRDAGNAVEGAPA